MLIWSIPKVEALVWIEGWIEQILSLMSSIEGFNFEMRIFVSKRQSGDIENGTGIGEIPGWSHDTMVSIGHGRCDVDAIVGEVFRQRIGAMVVGVCGPGRLGDSVRGAVRKRMDEGSIDFVEEGFSY